MQLESSRPHEQKQQCYPFPTVDTGKSTRLPVDVLFIDHGSTLFKRIASELRLRLNKANVIMAESSAKARQILKTVMVDAVVAYAGIDREDDDLIQPLLEFCQAHHERLRIIILTARIPAAVNAKFKSQQDVQYIEMPFNIDKIVRAIQNAV